MSIVRFQTKTFGVSWKPREVVNPLQVKSALGPFFRISGNSASSVRRNQIKRVIRQFAQIQPRLQEAGVVFHIHGKHTRAYPSWTEYLKGLQDDLEVFKQKFELAASRRREWVFYRDN
jgi:hypothetical protein